MVPWEDFCRRFEAVWRQADQGGRGAQGWENKLAKRLKDVEARWTKKHGRSHYGYKNPVNVGRRHKRARRYHVSDTVEHDSQVPDDILDGNNTAFGVWAEIKAALKEKGLRSRIHRKGRRNKVLSERKKQGNQARSSVQAPVEACLRGPEQRHGGCWCVVSIWCGRGRGAG